MQVRQVEYFLAIVDHGNIRRAAVALGLAQPSVSQSIGILERELGTKLFVRTGHGGVTLTSAGVAFLGPARRLVRTARYADLPGTESALDVVTWGNLSLDPTAVVVAELCRNNPELTVRIEHAEDEESVCDLVRHGHSELGTIYLPAAVRDLEVRKLGEVELWLILPPGTDPGPDPLPLSAIAEHSMIRISGGSQNAIVDHMLAEADIAVKFGVLSTHRQALVHLVLAGAGATLATDSYARQAAAKGAVVRRFAPSIKRQFAVIHRTEPLSAVAERFIELAANHQPWQGID